MSALTLLAFLPLTVWLYILLGRGMFWLARERDDSEQIPEPLQWPSVTAVVPARNEADVIARSIGSLLAQDYPGAFRIVVADDQSDDGTGEIARSLDSSGKLNVISGATRPLGWTGKLWAMSLGVARAGREAPDYLWFTDADIAHAPDCLRRLVARAEGHGLVLTSLMAKLSCATPAERFFIPAFVYFFQMLYPFAWVNDARNGTAAAAGGCMLVNRAALERAGGLPAIRNALIDDCALGKLMKGQGPIWLGLTERSVSIRPYAGMTAIRRMVARSAYAQLDYSPLLLAGTFAGLLMIFVAPALLALGATGVVRFAGIAAWLIMAGSFIPMLRFYNRRPFWALVLPAIGLLYAAFTLDSAVQHWHGRGGMWKGRPQAMAR
ncbi:MAG TPA: glycosyltransferase [Rhizomicrobium sp.]|jgi:hopene-associated glycosyltransferase HpnB|nr:glycosyltransferase [Rhizomicrobium sp.]